MILSSLQRAACTAQSTATTSDFRVLSLQLTWTLSHLFQFYFFHVKKYKIIVWRLPTYCAPRSRKKVDSLFETQRTENMQLGSFVSLSRIFKIQESRAYVQRKKRRKIIVYLYCHQPGSFVSLSRIKILTLFNVPCIPISSKKFNCYVRKANICELFQDREMAWCVIWSCNSCWCHVVSSYQILKNTLLHLLQYS